MISGHCTCGTVHYRADVAPLITHCCHCSWCQRETGSAFVVNALVERDQLVVEGLVEIVDTPSCSGRGQKITRCPTCRVALWSSYSSPAFAFVRVGTMDEPSRFPPDVHIFTSTRQPWVQLPDGVLAFTEFYDIPSVWSQEARARAAAAKERLG